MAVPPYLARRRQRNRKWALPSLFSHLLWFAPASCLGLLGFPFAGDACVGEGGVWRASLKLKNRERARRGSATLRSKPGAVKEHI